MRSPLGREAILRLAKKTDVLVHNFRPGVMERLGFGFDALHAINPRLIYAFGSGYGPTGPYKDKGGQDVLGRSWMALQGATPGATGASSPARCASWWRITR